MPRYVYFFTLKGETKARFLESPEDRRGPLTRLIEAAGGKLIDYYWMFGPYDGFTISEFPTSAAAAAAAMAVSSSGAFLHIETHELIEAEDLVNVFRHAQTLRETYRLPG
jgi:uncharacterized protein with GYD domain